MSAEVVENGVFSEDEFHDANDQEEQDATLVKKDVVTDVDEDRTDDQVPEITGTENVGDPMTISVDEVDEIPVIEGDVEEGVDGPKADEVPDQLENGAHADEEDGGGEVEEIPIDIVGEEEKPPAAEPQEEAVEEAAAEGEPEVVDVAEEQPAEEAAPPAEKEEAVQEIPIEVVEEVEPPAEELVQEVPVQEEADHPEEVAVEPEAQEEPVAAEETEDFQLQDPPQPKRPRTPNALDGAAATEDGDAVEAAEEPQGSVKGSQPGTPLPVGSPRRPSNAGSGVGSVPQTPKSPAGSIRRGSAALKSPLPNGSAISESPLANGVVPGTPIPATPRSGAAAPSPRIETPKTKTEFAFEQASPVATPRTPKKTVFDEDLISTTSSTKSKSPPKSPRSPRRARSPKKSTKFAEPPVEAEPEPEPEPVVEEVAPAEEEAQPEEPVEAQEEAPPVNEEATAPPAEVQPEVTEDGDAAPTETGDAEEPISRSRARVQSPSPPPREAPSREPRDYVPYDQDSHRETVPARLPTSTSFSSWVAPEREQYKAQSPWVSTAGKYRNEYTVGVPSHTAPYTSFFDDLVSTGPFSHSLYATSRLLERSRSRTRERRGALQSQRSASNYYRFASQYPAPLRTRDYSTPPTSAVNKPPSRAGSFISFLDYSGAKQYELARGTSYGSLYNSNQALSRSSSRGNIDYYLGTGRVSRVDNYVNNLNSRYEWQVPSNYEVYRSSSRGQVGYAPLNEYTSFTNSVYEENPRALRTAPVNPTMVRSMYEGRIDDLQRSLSRERYERDRFPSRRSRSRSCVRAVGPVLPFAAPHDPANDLTRSLYSGFARGWAQRAY